MTSSVKHLREFGCGALPIVNVQLSKPDPKKKKVVGCIPSRATLAVLLGGFLVAGCSSLGLDHTARSDDTQQVSSAAKLSTANSRANLAHSVSTPAPVDTVPVASTISGNTGSTDEVSERLHQSGRGILQYASADKQFALSGDTKLSLSDADLTPTSSASSATAASDGTEAGLQLVQSAQAQSNPPASQADDLAKLAQKSNNPIGDAWLLITQNDTTIIDGDAFPETEAINVTKFMPVLSVPVADGAWNFVIRPVVQYTSVPVDEDVGSLFGAGPNDIATNPGLASIIADPYGRTTGLGDTVLLTIAGPNTDSGWVFAGGISQILPTASEDVLGQGKYQVGPAGLALRLGKEHGGFGIEHFNFGLLPQQWWSYAGDDDRADTSQMDIQYILNWKATPTQLIGMTPNISINWEAEGGFDDKVSFPIGIGTIGLVKFGKLPIRWGAEAQYYLTGPDSVGKKWNLRFFIAPIIANPFK